MVKRPTESEFTEAYRDRIRDLVKAAEFARDEFRQVVAMWEQAKAAERTAFAQANAAQLRALAACDDAEASVAWDD